MVLVSVLVAVYNAEKYLDKCLNSLLNQTLKEIEIICVNDGSTDSSQEILERYACLDQRIKLYFQKNSGASSARNKGLEYACGKYICMVDSDDYISEDCLEKTYKLIEEKNLDAGIFKLIITDGFNEKDFVNKYDDKILNGEEACVLSLDWNIPGVGLYRSNIIKALKYNESNINGDELSTRKFLYNCRKIGFSPGEYYYFQNKNSVTRKFSIKRFDQLKNKIEIYKFLIDIGLYERAKVNFTKSLYDELLETIFLLKKADQKKFKLNSNEIKEIEKIQIMAIKILDINILRKYYLKKLKFKKYLYSFFSLKKLYKSF